MEVTVRVGDPDQSPEERAATLEALRAGDSQGAAPTVAAPPPDFRATAAHDAKELAALVEALRTVPIDEIGTPARNIAASGPEVWPALRELILAERKAPKGDYRALLSVIGGDVPNRYGHFALHWKKNHGYQVRVSDDWFEDLLTVPLRKVGRPLRDVYRDCVLQAAALRAASRVGREDPSKTADVIDALLDAAYVHRGTFRDEVGRAVVAVGDEAIAPLLRASVPPTNADPDSVEAKRADYATYNLDRMDRLHPPSAIEAVQTDPRRLADVLDAQGVAKLGAAAGPLLDHFDATTPAARNAARKAFLSFVTGPLPKTERRALRKLGGATMLKDAGLNYRQMATIAIRERLDAEFPTLREEDCDLRRPDYSIDRGCERQPERHTRAYIDALDDRRSAGQTAIVTRALSMADRDAATSLLDELLASGAAVEHPVRVADFYEVTADRLQDPRRAAQLLRKSAMLLADTDLGRAKSLRVRALVLESATPELDLAGREMLLESARVLDPDSSLVTRAVAHAHAIDAEGRDEGPERVGVRVGGLAAALFGVAGLGNFFRRRREIAPAPKSKSKRGANRRTKPAS